MVQFTILAIFPRQNCANLHPCGTFFENKMYIVEYSVSGSGVKAELVFFYNETGSDVLSMMFIRT